jgi:putative transcriptional regulator
MTGDDLRGKLLVAQPALRDSNFDRAVVMVLEHGDDGAIGLVLNRPTPTDLADAWPDWGAYAASPPVVFAGGPVVEEGAAICLSRSRAADPSEAWQPVISGIGTLDVSRAPGEVGTDIEEVRLFAGYAGWGAGQLEAEIAGGSWFVVEAKPVDSFTSDPEGLWKAVLGRQRGMMAWFANFPPDPSLN